MIYENMAWREFYTFSVMTFVVMIIFVIDFQALIREWKNIFFLKENKYLHIFLSYKSKCILKF